MNYTKGQQKKYTYAFVARTLPQFFFFFFQNKDWIFAIIVNMLRGDFVTFTIYQTRGGGGTDPRKVRVGSAGAEQMKLYQYNLPKKGGLFYYPPPPD